MKRVLRRADRTRPEILLGLVVIVLLLVSLMLATRQTTVKTVTGDDRPFVGSQKARDKVDTDEETGDTSAQPRHFPGDSDDIREQEFVYLRSKMVEQQIAARGVDDQRVLDAMRRVPRHKFVPDEMRDVAYRDSPLPIGHRQTISQPLIVAMMTQLAQPGSRSKALDVGTGSGYQAAVLAELVDQVYSIEILKPLADESRERLRFLGYDNIEVRCGDGYRGWPQHAPFDVIIVAAAPDHVPQPLIDQLATGGHLVIPVGERFMQSLLVSEKQPDGTVRRRNVSSVSFVPMTGEAQED